MHHHIFFIHDPLLSLIFVQSSSSQRYGSLFRDSRYNRLGATRSIDTHLPNKLKRHTQTDTMPALANVEPKIFARFFDSAPRPSPMNAGTIVAIICAGILPVLIVTGVVIWMLGFYGRGRGCCCARRQRREGRNSKLQKSQGAGREDPESGTPLQTLPHSQSSNTLEGSLRPPRTANESGEQLGVQEPRGFV